MKKQLLKETIILTEFNRKPIEVKEGIEKTTKHSFIYESVPVWRLDVKNLNERIYSTELAEQLVSENATTNVLRNHLDDFVAEITDIKAIAKRPHIEDNMLKVDMVMVDEVFAGLVEKIIDAGGKVGLSSVGYGSVNDETGVVEDYSLVRYADFVINPAALVFIEKEVDEPEEESLIVPEEIEEPHVEEETSSNTETTTVEVETISNEEFLDIQKGFKVKYGKN